MTDTLQFELVTPEKLAVSEAVTMVEVPGEMGDFGVLPGHAPFLSMIRPGVIRVHKGDGEAMRYFVPSGYAEVNPEGCIVLAEQVRNLKDITHEQAQEELNAAKEQLSIATESHEKEQAEKAVTVAETLVASL